MEIPNKTKPRENLTCVEEEITQSESERLLIELVCHKNWKTMNMHSAWHQHTMNIQKIRFFSEYTLLTYNILWSEVIDFNDQ